jgi:hypothetical protein
MALSSNELVIRARTPLRLWVLAGAIVLTGLLLMYVAFEYGRSRAGHDQMQVMLDRQELHNRIATLEEELRGARGELAAADTSRLSQARERVEVTRAIGELQAQLSRQSQELAFYKGIVSQDTATAEVKIQRVRLTQNGATPQFKLQVTLVQPVRPENVVAGNVQVFVEGVRAGASVRMGLAQLTSGKAKDLPYSFRYVENLAADFTVPADLRPERLTVEVHSNRRGVAPVVQTAVWSPEPA